MIQQIITIVGPLFIIAAVGYFYGSRVRPEMRITNQLIMDVFMPALIFHVMIQDDFYPLQYLNLMGSGALLMLLSGVAAYFFSRIFGYSWRAFVPSAMFSNWANLGLPLYVFSLGDAALGAGVMLVVAGNLLCFTIGTYIYSGKLTGLEVLRTPMIVAVILGGALNALNVHLPSFIHISIDMLGRVAIPLMLFSLGVRLTRVSWGHVKPGLVMGLFCPIVGMALALILCKLIPMSQLHQNILILFGALPPAVINFMLAEQYDREPESVASMVLIGNMMSIISLPLALLYVLSGSG